MDNEGDEHGQNDLNDHQGPIKIDGTIIVEVRRAEIKVPHHFPIFRFLNYYNEDSAKINQTNIIYCVSLS